MTTLRETLTALQAGMGEQPGNRIIIRDSRIVVVTTDASAGGDAWCQALACADLLPRLALALETAEEAFREIEDYQAHRRATVPTVDARHEMIQALLNELAERLGATQP